jgi:hypothetical protein
MGNPRDEVAFDGIGELPVTFKHDGSIVFDHTKPGGSAQVGRAVMITAARTVGLATDGAAIKGRLEHVESDGFCHVVVDGYVKLPARTGAIPANGASIVGALGGVGNAEPGFIRAVAPGVPAELAASRGEVANNADGTAVVVQL